MTAPTRKVIGSPPTATVLGRRAAVPGVLNGGPEPGSLATLVRENLPLCLALFLLMTSRWGSYLPFGQTPDITTVVVVVIIGMEVFAKRPRPRFQRYQTVLRPAVALFVFWCTLEFVRGSVSVNAIRDAVPYFFSLLVLVARPVTADGQDVTDRRLALFLDVGIWFHAAWVALALVAKSLVASLPNLTPGVQLFALENGFDGDVCATFAVLMFYRALCGRRVVYNVAGSLLNLGLLLGLSKRAGLLCFLAEVVLFLWIGVRHVKPGGQGVARIIVSLLLIASPIAILVASSTVSAQRSLYTVERYIPFIDFGVSSDNAVSANGTERARSHAWKRIGQYMGESAPRDAFGVGFGPNYLHNSGADVLLLGGPNSSVRDPHSYLYGSWARLGLVGLSILAVMVFSGVLLAGRLRSRDGPIPDLDLLAALIAVGFPAASLVDTLMVAPFGALPYFWALGHLGSRAIKSGERPALRFRRS